MRADCGPNMIKKPMSMPANEIGTNDLAAMLCQPRSQSLLYRQSLAGQLHRFFRLAIEVKVSLVLGQRLRGFIAQFR